MNNPLGRDSFITIAILSVSVAGFLFGVYFPAQKSAERIDREIAAAQQSIREVPLRIAELESLCKNLCLRNDFLWRTQQLIPPEANIHSILRQVTKLANKTHLKITRLEPLPAIEHKSYAVLPFRFSFTGPFQGMAEFLRGLENQPRMFTLEELTISNQEEHSSQSREADLYFSVYVKNTESDDSAEYDTSWHQFRSDTRNR